MMDSELTEVRFLMMPISLHQRASQHLDELQRELTYIAAEPGSVPERLADLSARITNEFGAFGGGPRSELQAAAAAGKTAIDVSYWLPPHAGEAAVLANAMLDEVEEYCREGGLLALGASADVLAYRRWFFHEFTSQCNGASPCSWPEWWDAAQEV